MKVSQSQPKILLKKFNQLFRNQLIAEALIQHKEFDFVITGLFCHHDDKDAIDSGNEFKNMLNKSDHDFMIVTFRDFIETVQKLDKETRIYSARHGLHSHWHQ